MPYYDYRCEECGGTFEVKQRMSEAGESASPACECCGSDRTRRVFASFFSGSGGDGGTTPSGPT